MRLALAGPVHVPDLLPWLDWGGRDPAELPEGMGATPASLLARGLLGRGFELLVVTLDPSVEREVVVSGPQLRVCFVPFRGRHRGRDAYRVERRWLAGVLRRESPGLVHAHWSYEYALAGLASGVATLVTVHDWAPTILRLMPDPYRLVRLGMFVRVLAGAEHLTTVSPYLAALLRRWGRPPLEVVPNGVDDAAFDPSERARGGEPVVIAINEGFSKRKNVSALLRAHPLVRDAHPGCRLVLVGRDHEPGGPAQRWARERGLEEGVEFRGQVPYAQVRELLGQADVFVHPSLEESFGMVVLEAMARGLPVVAGERSGAVPWVLDEGRAGVLTDITKPERIAGAVQGLLADEERRTTTAQAGYRHAWDHFRMTRVEEQYLALYERVRPGVLRGQPTHQARAPDG